MTQGRFRKGKTAPSFMPFFGKQARKGGIHGERTAGGISGAVHMGALNAATSRELELTFGIKGIQVRRHGQCPAAGWRPHRQQREWILLCRHGPGGAGHHRPSDQADQRNRGRIRGLDRTLEREDTAQTRLPLDGVIRLNSFMSWIGGKKALRELIVRLFPLYYERYIEVFGGGGWVLFHKPPGNDFEVYNDFNGLLVNLYRCVRDKPEELMEALRYVLNAREDFDRIRSALARDSPASDVQRAAWFYQLIRYSYASGLTSFGSQPHDMRSNFSLIEQAHRRLAKVVIENKDFEKLLHQYDRPVSFFYLDPPYHATEGYYQNIGEDGFTEADHIRLRDALMRIEGKFLLSYNDDAFVRGLYDRPGIYLMETTRINNIKQRYDNGAQFPELLIANYDLRERSRAVPSQMTLFDWNGGEAIG